MKKETELELIRNDCVSWLTSRDADACKFALTFLDPPFNQGKEYRNHNDAMSDAEYWQWMTRVCELTLHHTCEGGSIYFMQREKNTAKVIETLERSGWQYQNLIIWKKLTSAIPAEIRFGKSFQIIVFATKGRKPAVFHKLRIDPPLPAHYKPRATGRYVTDIWDDIRELTSGYYAGDEAIRNSEGTRAHKQQSPIALLLRIILSSSLPGMTVFDPFAGTGTTGVVAYQLGRHSELVEKDSINLDLIKNRLEEMRPSDSIERFKECYKYTKNLTTIWHNSNAEANGSR